MNGKQLKNSILQWAIQGKLVPQDPNDEPASVLLEKIRQEKERLIKEKKIKRDKNASIIYRGEDNSYYEKMLATGEVKCIDEEIPFDVPNGWEWCRICHVAEIARGGSPRPIKEYLTDATDGINWIKIGDTEKDSKYITSVKERIKQSGVSKSRMVHKGDFLLTNSMSFGRPYITQVDGCIHDGWLVISLIEQSYRQDFFYYLLSSGYAYSQFAKRVAGAVVQNLNSEKVAISLFPLPPYKEQNRIVQKIKDLLPLVEKFGNDKTLLDKLNADINTRLKKSILQEAIQGKLVPQIAEEGTAQELLEQIKKEKQKLVKEGKLKKSTLATSVIFRGDDNKYYEKIGKKCVDITEEIPFSIPANWKWVRIRDVFQLNPKNEADDETLAAFIPMEKVSAGYKSDFTFDLVKWGNIKKGFTHFANGDVAFAKITPCFQNRKSAIFHGLPNGIGAGTTELKVLRPYGNTIGRWYLLYFLESPYFIDEATFKGTANQQRIVVGYLENKLFPLPPKEEQQRIVAQIEKLFEQLH